MKDVDLQLSCHVKSFPNKIEGAAGAETYSAASCKKRGKVAAAGNVVFLAVKGAMAVGEAALAARELSANWGREDLSIMDHIRTASAVNKLVCCGFSIAEIGSFLAGAENSTLMQLKSYEMLPRFAEFPIQIFKCMTQTTENPSIDFEKVFIGPLAGLLEASTDRAIYYEKHFIAMSPEERERATRPIYKWDHSSESVELVGYRPVILEECQANLAKLQTESLVSGSIRLAAENGVLSATYRKAESLYERLALFLREYAIRALQIQDREDPNPDQPFNLMALPMIPVFLHEDAVFSQYICPITHMPIRRPVGDPTNGMTIYEYSAIVSWLAVSQRSPMTNLPLTVDQLIERPAIQALVDNRLQAYQQRLMEYIESNPEFQQQLTAPSPAALSQAAEAENQNVRQLAMN